MSTKVRLPSDALTPAELKQQSGPVSTYNLSGPMKWEDLLALPDDLRKQYIEKLRDEYKATQIMLAGMLGTTEGTFRRWAHKWGIKFKHNGGHLPEKAKQRWRAFLGGEETLPAETMPAPAPTEPKRVADIPPICGTMAFKGPAGAALRKAYETLGEMPCNIVISWDAKEE